MSLDKKRLINGSICLVIFSFFNFNVLSRFFSDVGAVFGLSCIVGSFLTILYMIFVELTLLNNKKK